MVLRLVITNKNYAKEIKIEGVLFGFRVWCNYSINLLKLIKFQLLEDNE
jgi:hypothetical protein